MLAEDGEAVTVDARWHWIWRAWHRLSPERHWQGGGMGPDMPGDIPWTAVMRWADRHGLDGAAADMLDHCIGEMDRVFVKWWAARVAVAADK